MTDPDIMPLEEALAHSTTERVMKDVPQPPSKKLTTTDLFDSITNKPDVELLKKHLIAEGRIDESAALRIINEGAELLR